LELSREEKRGLVMELASTYSVHLICRGMGLPRSSFYYRPSMDPEELLLRDEMEHIAAEYPRYGYRRIAPDIGLTLRGSFI